MKQMSESGSYSDTSVPHDLVGLYELPPEAPVWRVCAVGMQQFSTADPIPSSCKASMKLGIVSG